MLGPRNAAVVEYRVALDGGGYAWVWAERLRAQAAEDAAEDAEVLCMQGEWQQLRCRCLFTMAPLFDPARGRSCTHLPMCNYDALCRCVPCLLRRCRHSPIVERTAWPCPPAGTLESPAAVDVSGGLLISPRDYARSSSRPLEDKRNAIRAALRQADPEGTALGTHRFR